METKTTYIGNIPLTKCSGEMTISIDKNTRFWYDEEWFNLHIQVNSVDALDQIIDSAKGLKRAMLDSEMKFDA